jgi:mRNA interferase YafQ
MRKIEYSNAFKKDYKRIKVTPRHAKDVDKLLSTVVQILAEDKELPLANRDHSLSGNWVSYRECHLKPDLLLIYKKQAKDTLRLARFGSYSELFG